MKLKLCLGVALALVLAWAGGAQATSLIGQNVTGALTGLIGSTNSQFSPAATTVLGANFTGSFTDGFKQDWGFSVGFTASTISIGITSFNNVNGNLGGSSPVADLSLTGFTGIDPLRFRSYSCSSAGFDCFINEGPAENINISNGTTFDVSWNTIRNGDIYVFSSRVPEPASWSIMLVGFGCLGVAMRARRKPATGKAAAEPARSLAGLQAYRWILGNTGRGWRGRRSLRIIC